MKANHSHHPEHDHDEAHNAEKGHHHEVVYSKVVKSKHKVAAVLLNNAKTVELSFDERQEVPHEIKTTDGQTLVCHVDDVVEVGDRLVSNTNEWAIVAAAAEALFEVPRGQTHFEEFLYVTGLNFWPMQLTDTGARVVASHECLDMLEHFKLKFNDLTASIHEIGAPEVKHPDHGDHEHGPECNHSH